ncbi:hypothetical protein F5B22DRAFT_616171 [Xylaria bambusicola]|uniref:uncharacterized protein n=1 Tax=Xylaria bambusicola TaxID=326684 RepID=UPI002008E5ED|nr:uncharacterized protein F5B22DRAFT_616171 [Xylaria bambusicola]KAI0509599.1 hypothetical protein F5B22DRAFT_616171 [Xylaria bambusicola]
MDPVTAVGVAAAAVQFLDASIKVYNTFQEIRGSSILTTKHNEQLEDNIRSVQSLRSSLKSACTPQGANDPVSKLSDQCISKADELLKLLEYIRGSGKDISRARALSRAVRKRKAIEELHYSLKEGQDTLNHMITQKLLPSIDMLKVEQSKEFANINSIGQELIKAQLEQQRIQEAHHTTLTDKLDSIQCDTQLRLNEADHLKKREKLLGSLWFPEIDQRRNEIKEPAPRTLEWLFDPEYYTPSESNDHQLLWPDFRRWLREDTSTYWISGKAGSGKSTLMAHIVDDERTCKNLEVWSRGYRLRVLSFFFWRAGSQLQNSVLGLLRSLLYQLCILEPEIADIILSKLSSPMAMIPTWTERSLLSFATEAIRSSKGTRFCIFIDGLDEYTGPYDDLVDHIDKLSSFGNSKACLSSRPEVALTTRFQGLKQLRLQDLNSNDIKAFVKGSLQKTQLSKHFRSELISEVTWRSDGVFLWASLVAQSLVRGSNAGDSEEILRERLDTLPNDMNHLFEHMLSKVDPVHRKSLAFYVQIMNIARKDSPVWYYGLANTLPIIVTAQLEKDINSYEEFLDECKLTEMRIATRTAGLLEVGWISGMVSRFLNEYYWEAATFRFATTHPRFMWIPDISNRRICSKDEPYLAMSYSECKKLKWIHRSAFEFLSNLDSSPLLEYSWSPEALFRQIGEAHITYAITAPSYVTDTKSSLLHDLLTPTMIFLGAYYDDYPTIASSLLDTLCTVCTQLDNNEFQGTEQRQFLAPDAITPAGKYWFWIQCVESPKLQPYALSRLNFIFTGSTCESLVAHILWRTLYTFRSPDYLVNTLSTQLVNSLADVLSRSIMEGHEVGGFSEAAEYNSIIIEKFPRNDAPVIIRNFNSATWKESIKNRCMLDIMKRLMKIVDDHTLFYNRLVPISLLTLMDFMGLYVSPTIWLNKIRIQISAKAWTMLWSAIDYRTIETGTIGRHISATEVDGAVQILCWPSHTSTQNVSRRFNDDYVHLSEVKELQVTDFICLRPSAATSDRVLSLLGYRFYANQYKFEFGILPDTQKLLEVTDMLLQEIKSDEQGLDGGQQLLAAACVKAGLLNIDSDQFLHINDPAQSSHDGNN